MLDIFRLLFGLFYQLLIIMPLFGIFSALLASQKNRSVPGWFLVGFFLGPFGLLVGAMPTLEIDKGALKIPPPPLNYNIVDMVAKGTGIDDIASELNQSKKEIILSCLRLLEEGEITKDQFDRVKGDVVIEEYIPETKKCPFCAEEIKFEAIKCKHCGSNLI